MSKEYALLLKSQKDLSMNHCHILNRQIQQYYLTISALRISWFRLGIFLLQPSHPCMCLQSVGKLNFQQERACCAASDVTMWLSLVKQSWCVALIKKTKLRWLHTKWSSSQFESTYDTTPEHKTSCTQTFILVYVHLSFTANFSKALRVWMHDCAHMWVLEHVHVCLALTVITKQ